MTMHAKGDDNDCHGDDNDDEINRWLLSVFLAACLECGRKSKKLDIKKFCKRDYGNLNSKLDIHTALSCEVTAYSQALRLIRWVV